MQERLLSVGESATHQAVNANTIYKWFDRKEMPTHKLGPLWQFLTSEVDQWSKGAHVAEDIAIETPAAATQPKQPRH